MPRVAIRPSQDLARLFRKRRHELNLTLRQVEERTRAFGKLIPFSTLGKVEQGRVDPGVIRFQQLLEVYDLPQGAALDLVALEAQRAELPKRLPPEELLEEAVRLWKAGESGRAVAALYALREAAARDARLSELGQRGQLQLAVVVGGLGRLQLAKQLIEELLTQKLPGELLLRCFIQLAVCCERLKMPELALACLLRAEDHAANAGPREAACVAQERGLIELALGQYVEAQKHLAQAQALYERAGDEQGVVKASFSLVRVLLRTAQSKQAVRSAQRLLETIDAPHLSRFRPEATVLLGHAYLAGRQLEQALTTLRVALAEAVSLDSTSARFLAHHYLAHAYRAAGDAERARAEERAAADFRKYIDFEPDPVVFEGGKTDGAQHHQDAVQRKHRHRPRK